MDPHLKQRLLGTAVIVSLAVIFIPMLFTEETERTDRQEWRIPEPPHKRELKPLPLPDKPFTIETDDTDATEPVIAADPLNAPLPPTEDEAEPPQPVEPTSAAAANKLATPKPARPVPPQPSPSVVDGHAKTLSAWAVQVGSFSRKKNALAIRDKLRKAGLAAFIEPLSGTDTTMYRVRVGPELDKQQAAAKRDHLKESFGLNGIVVPYSGAPSR